MRDPLGDVELVELVVFYAVLEEPVDQLADTSHGTSLGQVVKLVHWIVSFEWDNDDVNEQVNDFDFSQELLVLNNGCTIAMERILAVGLDYEEHQSCEQVFKSFQIRR